MKNEMCMDAYVLQVKRRDGEKVLSKQYEDVKHVLNGYARFIEYRQIDGRQVFESIIEG